MRYRVYKEIDIMYNEDFNTWSGNGLTAPSYRELIEQIDAQEKKLKSLKLNKFKALTEKRAFSGSNYLLEEVEVTSIAGTLDKTPTLWIKDSKGNRTKNYGDIYKIDEEIYTLMEAYKKITSRIEEWKKKHKYSSKEIIDTLGYPEEYVKRYLTKLEDEE